MKKILKDRFCLFCVCALIVIIFIIFNIIRVNKAPKQMNIFMSNSYIFNNTLWMSEDPPAYFACENENRKGQIRIGDDVYNFDLAAQMTAYYFAVDNYDIHSICELSVKKYSNKEIQFYITKDPYDYFENYDTLTFKGTKFNSFEELNEKLNEIKI